MSDKRPEVHDSEFTMNSGIGIHDKTGTAKITGVKGTMNGPVGVAICIGEVPEDIQQQIDDASSKKTLKKWLAENLWLPLLVALLSLAGTVIYDQYKDRDSQPQEQQPSKEKSAKSS